jgi:hypothetical protein
MTTRFAACSCGQLHLTTHEEPLRVSICHCLACQRRTGSVFGAQARFRWTAVAVTGESSVYVRVGDEGGKAAFHFCPKCGAIVYWLCPDNPDHVAVPVGSFAEPGFPVPTFSVYEERMHSWVCLPDNIEHMA